MRNFEENLERMNAILSEANELMLSEDDDQRVSVLIAEGHVLLVKILIEWKREKLARALGAD